RQCRLVVVLLRLQEAAEVVWVTGAGHARLRSYVASRQSSADRPSEMGKANPAVGVGSPGGRRSRQRAGHFSRFASPSPVCSWPSRSNFASPLIVSPLSLPWYVNTTLLPPNSRVTLNDTASPVTLPSSISVSAPCRPVIVPVSFSPCCLSFSVVSKV